MSVSDYELKFLKNSILEMAALVETFIKDAVSSLLNNDVELARKVIRSDHLVNSYDIRIDEDCIKLIALKQPIGKHLRLITTAMKMASDLERIADNAVNIAERDIDIADMHQIDPTVREDIFQMSEIVQSMLRDAISSFVNEDKLLAMDVITRDEAVDKLDDKIFQELMTQMHKCADCIYSGSRISYVSIYLERIGDHATNLAEMVIYMVEGRIIRHIALDKIKTIKDSAANLKNL
jgi:phosphate transport system protein